MKKNSAFFLIVIITLLLASCGGDDDSEKNKKTYGSEGGYCYPDGSCDLGFECNETMNMCFEAEDCITGEIKCSNNVFIWCDDGDWLYKECGDNKICSEKAKGCIFDDSGDSGDSGNSGNTGDTSSDPKCENYSVETGEVCDGDSKDCNGLAGIYSGGTAPCRSDCTGYDESFCRNKWRIQINSVELTEKMADGSSWDVPGGMPDVWINVLHNDELILETETKEDTLSPGWTNEYVDVSISNTDKFVFEFWDEDTNDHDNFATLSLSTYVVDRFNDGELTEENYENLETKFGIISFSISFIKK